MKALVISGGGSKGAFGGGIAEYLINGLGKKYDIFLGCSTGSLLIPFMANGNIDRIKEVYTNVTQDDIFSICPFNVYQDETGAHHAKINHFNTIKMFLKGKRTFGQHKNLLKTIQNVLTREEFEKCKKLDSKIIVTVSNFTTRNVEYKYLKDCSYEDFCKWMWASASFVPFMNLVKMNGYDYADGGFGNYLPIEEAVNLGATEVDVIVLRQKRKKLANIKMRNPFDVLFQALYFMQKQIVLNDLMIGYLESIYNNDVKVNFIFTPRELTDFSFVFNPVQMKEWWAEGYEYAKNKFSNK